MKDQTGAKFVAPFESLLVFFCFRAFVGKNQILYKYIHGLPIPGPYLDTPEGTMVLTTHQVHRPLHPKARDRDSTQFYVVFRFYAVNVRVWVL